MISSASNPRIKHLVRLRKRRDRDAEGVTLVEGLSELRRAAEAGVDIAAIFHNPEVIPNADLPDAEETIEVSATALAKASMRDSTEGLIAVVAQPTLGLSDLTLPANPLVLVVEAVEKPGNLGAMLRTADAAGVDAVLVADPVTDPWNPNVVRSSIGCVFTVPVVTGTVGEALGWVDAHDLRLHAADPVGGAPLHATDLTGSVAVAIGAEHAGLSPTLRQAASPITIPMRGSADSLNASVSAAIVLYEALRQRS